MVGSPPVRAAQDFAGDRRPRLASGAIDLRPYRIGEGGVVERIGLLRGGWQAVEDEAQLAADAMEEGARFVVLAAADTDRRAAEILGDVVPDALVVVFEQARRLAAEFRVFAALGGDGARQAIGVAGGAFEEGFQLRCALRDQGVGGRLANPRWGLQGGALDADLLVEQGQRTLDVGQRVFARSRLYAEQGGDLQSLRDVELFVGQPHGCGVVEQDDELALHLPFEVARPDRFEQDDDHAEDRGGAEGLHGAPAALADDAALVAVDLGDGLDTESAHQRGGGERPIGC